MPRLLIVLFGSISKSHRKVVMNTYVALLAQPLLSWRPSVWRVIPFLPGPAAVQPLTPAICYLYIAALALDGQLHLFFPGVVFPEMLSHLHNHQ